MILSSKIIFKQFKPNKTGFFKRECLKIIEYYYPIEWNVEQRIMTSKENWV